MAGRQRGASLMFPVPVTQHSPAEAAGRALWEPVLVQERWGGEGFLSQVVAFWPEDLGVLGGFAKMSLRRKIGSLTCDLLT